MEYMRRANPTTRLDSNKDTSSTAQKAQHNRKYAKKKEKAKNYTKLCFFLFLNIAEQ